MRIRVAEHAELSPNKMAKIALATTRRAQLDLYCVGPGQSQAVHAHADQDKIYYVIEGAGQFTLGAREERLDAGDALVAPSGAPHGLVNDGDRPLLVLVVVTPPPAHAERPR
jgi:quercetin dioxygenase-like cupin family protein